jgi:hypothetical protein
MVSAPQLSPVSAPVPVSSNPTGQLARALPGFDPGPVIDAHELNLADYLNQPVHNILARLGLPGVPQAAPPAGTPNTQTPAGPANPNGGSPAGGQNAGMLSSLASMLIQPVTEALGTLGSGQFGDLDPTQMLGGVTQALESAGQSVQHAMAGLGGVWQGDAASAAAAKTTTALANGTQVASQATSLSESLSAATANVGQAEAQLVEIVSQFMATLAAIGPNIIFPWGIAAAIAAANHAITMTTQVMSQLVSSLTAEAGNVTATGAPVAVTSAPQAAGAASAAPVAAAAASASGVGAPTAAFAAPVSASAAPLGAIAAPAGATSALGSSFSPMLQLASGLASPAMMGVSAATGALQSGGQTPSAQAGGGSGSQDQDGDGGSGDGSHHKAPSSGGVGPGGVGGVPVGTMQSRLAEPIAVPVTDTTSETAVSADAVAPDAVGGAPMMGGAPMGQGARAGVSRSHNTAAFLHTTDQGDEIVGNLGNVAPPVIGERDTKAGQDIELRI